MDETQQQKHTLVQEAVKKLLDESKIPMRLHLQVVEALHKRIKEYDQSAKQHADHIDRHENQLNRFDSTLDSYDSEIRRLHTLPHIKGESGIPGKDADTEAIIARILQQIPFPEDGKDADEEAIIKSVLGRIPMPKNGEDGATAVFDEDSVFKNFITKIRKEKSIDISDIGNAQSFLFNNKRYKIEELMKGGGPILSGRGALLSYDISSQFNGIVTTFTLPAYLSIIQFIITGWPPNGVLRPTVDFTTPSSTTVALVPAQVTAPVTGTSGIIIYVSA